MRCIHRVKLVNKNVLNWQRKLSMDNDGIGRLSVGRVPGHRTSYREGAAAVCGPDVVELMCNDD